MVLLVAFALRSENQICIAGIVFHDKYKLFLFIN